VRFVADHMRDGTRGTGHTVGFVLPHDVQGDAAHDACGLVVHDPRDPSGLAILVRNLPRDRQASNTPGDLFAAAALDRLAAAAPDYWAAQARDMSTLAGAAARDRGNARGTWTAEEVAAADRLDDAYEQDDMRPLGAGLLGPDGAVDAQAELDGGMTAAQLAASDRHWKAANAADAKQADAEARERRLAPSMEATRRAMRAAETNDEISDLAG
jgi:hypothetical protein